jgi:heme-degrading monooxygenase HmoA
MAGSTTSQRTRETTMTDGAEHFASGSWHVANGNAAEFLERWRAFLEWTRDSSPGFVTAILIQDVAQPRHYISVASWASAEARAAWQSNPVFAERLGSCRMLCDDFSGGSYRLAVAIGP